MSSHLNVQLIQERQDEINAALEHARHSNELHVDTRTPRARRMHRVSRVPRIALVALQQRIAG